MSRSIHTTYRALSDFKKQDHSSTTEPEKKIRQMRQHLGRKHSLKASVRRERKRTSIPGGQFTRPEDLPIKVLDHHDKIHYPASEQDIRAVLLRLPAAAVEGLTEIRLELGKARMEERPSKTSDNVDPWLGRLSRDYLPGIYTPPVLGIYQSLTSTITIFAAVYDTAQLPLPQSLCEFYLRLHALKTLVHEVAHHHDFCQRVGRGRWLADRHENLENYAENMEHRWTLEIVIPYLEEAYPREARALPLWVARRGGWKPPLSFFAGDTRQTLRSGKIRWICNSTDAAFEGWVDDLSKGCPPCEAWLDLAWQLHYADLYEECLSILDRRLKRNPQHTPLLICRADTLEHLKQYSEALTVIDQVIQTDPLNSKAWQTRGDIFVGVRDWIGLLDNCDRFEALKHPDDTPIEDRRTFSEHRAVAFYALGDESAMNQAIAAYMITFQTNQYATRREEMLRRRIRRWAGISDSPATTAP